MIVTTLRIKELSEDKGWNISDLARRAKIPYPTALALWHDKIGQLNRITLDRVALALGVKVGELFAGDPDASVLDDD